MKNIGSITIDVEPWYLIENMKSLELTADRHDSRIEYQCDLMLDLLDQLNCQATLFCLANPQIAYSKLLRRISEAGHEIASHGVDHVMLERKSIQDIKLDISDSKKVLEDIVQKPVKGYRAPCFSVREELFEILSELGFTYDSSWNLSSLNSRYGSLNHLGNDPESIINYIWNKYSIREYPLLTSRVLSINLPTSGGGFGRLLPRFLWRFLLTLNKKPVSNVSCFYFHPWELDKDLPRIPQSLYIDFCNYYHLSGYSEKIYSVLSHLNLEFVTLGSLNADRPPA